LTVCNSVSASKTITGEPDWIGPAISPLTADTALRLARLLKTSPQLWMQLQADWDLHEAIQ
jgi:hypothetical protein